MAKNMARKLTDEEHAEFLRLQAEEMQSQDNLYFAGKRLGRAPDRTEAGLHYALFGGAENFRERWEREHPPEKSVAQC